MFLSIPIYFTSHTKFITSFKLPLIKNISSIIANPYIFPFTDPAYKMYNKVVKNILCKQCIKNLLRKYNLSLLCCHHYSFTVTFKSMTRSLNLKLTKAFSPMVVVCQQNFKYLVESPKKANLKICCSSLDIHQKCQLICLKNGTKSQESCA